MNSQTLTEDQRIDSFILDFEQGRIPPNALDHEAHLRLAWSYLQRAPLPETLIKIRDGLRRFASAAGQPQKYHETVTFALVALIAERQTPGQTWSAFLEANEDLLTWKRILARYYRPQTLASEGARQRFVFPDSIVAR